MAGVGTEEVDVVVDKGLPKDGGDEARNETESSRGRATSTAPMIPEDDAEPPRTWKDKYPVDTMSNIITFCLMVLGIICVAVTDNHPAARFVLAGGLFSFAGSITNQLAITALFDPVLGLPGTGIIPKRFKEIRQTIKDTIMKTFFDADFLEAYIDEQTSKFKQGLKLDEKLKQMLESDAVDKIIDDKLADLNNRPEGMMLAMAGINPLSLKPMIKPFVLGMGTDLAPVMLDTLDPKKMMTIDQIRDEIDKMMSEKLLLLTAPLVKRVLRDVIQKHLVWLVVWGGVFGGLIGITSEAVTQMAGV